MIKLELHDAEVISRLDKMPGRVHDEIKIGIGRLVIKLARDWVQAKKLRGQALNYKTGRLYRSIGSVVNDDGNTVAGIVSTPLRYGKAHEYGFKGTVTVREHMRQQVMAFGKPMEPKEVTVKAHPMKMNLPERSFLRSALREFQEAGLISQEIDADIARALA